jgi:putative flippase GtrA
VPTLPHRFALSFRLSALNRISPTEARRFVFGAWLVGEARFGFYPMFKSELFWKLARFAAVGLTVMAVFMGLNWVLGHWLGEQVAFLVAYPPSVGLHFALNKWWTFSDRSAATRRQVGEYLAMVAVTFVIQWSVFTALQYWTMLPGWIAAGVANLAQMAVSFGLMQVRIFAKRAGAVTVGVEK